MLKKEIRKGRPKFAYSLNVSSDVYKYLRRGLFPKMPRIVKPLQKRKAKAVADKWRAATTNATAIRIKFFTRPVLNVPFPN